MERLSRWVLAHATTVLSLTTALVIAGGAAIALLLPRLSEQNAYPDLASYRANQAIATHIGTGGYDRPYLPVVVLPEGRDANDPSVRAALGEAFTAVERETGSRTASVADSGDRVFVGDDPRVTFGLVYRPRAADGESGGGISGAELGEGDLLDAPIAQAMRPHLPPGATVQVTGLDTLSTGVDAGGLDIPAKLAVTLVGAIVILAWVFRSSLAFVPLLIALIAMPVSFIGLLALSGLTPIHETTMQMVPLLGLGIAIDYSLILVTRWREEHATSPGDAHEPAGADAAVHRAMATSGHAVLFSGLAVALGLVSMTVLPIPIMRSLALGGVMVALASVLTSLTVLPLVLAALGRRQARRAVPDHVDAREARAGRAWRSWARLVLTHPVVATCASVLALGTLCIVGLGIDLNTPSSDNLSRSTPGRVGLTVMERAGLGSGALSSFDVFVPASTSVADVTPVLANVPGVEAVVTGGATKNAAWHGDGGSVVTVVPAAEGGTPEGRAIVERTRDAVAHAVPDGVLVGGNVAQQMDYIDAAYGPFPWMFALLALVTFVLLARAFRSIVLPLKAVLLNLLSSGAVLGVMVILWQWGWGTELLFGVQPNGTVGTFVPLTIFVFLFGLTMDYEVFILTRMREEYDRTGSTHEAVVESLGRTGRLVTCAALILVLSFASMTVGGEVDVAVFASGMALGLLLDATLIRGVLVPATVVLFGRWNWWLPAWAARVLGVPASPAHSLTVRRTAGTAR